MHTFRIYVTLGAITFNYLHTARFEQEALMFGREDYPTADKIWVEEV